MMQRPATELSAHTEPAEPPLGDQDLLRQIAWQIIEHPEFNGVWHLYGDPQVLAGEDDTFTSTGRIKGVILPGPDPCGSENFRFFEPLDAESGDSCLAAEMLLANLDEVTVGGWGLSGAEHFLLLEWVECDKADRGRHFTAEMMQSLIATPLFWDIAILLARGERLVSHWERHGFTALAVSHDADDGVPVSLMVASRYALESHPSNVPQL